MPDSAAEHLRRHERSHAESELYDNPNARQHRPGGPAPVPAEAVTEAEAHVLHRITMWNAAATTNLPLDEYPLTMRKALIRDVLEAAAPRIAAQAVAAERARMLEGVNMLPGIYQGAGVFAGAVIRDVRALIGLQDGVTDD